ncbi:MAG TPA: PQQ-dependent sugar dehydrogenase, partial [Thermoleophilaceae bacterium]|nr:PQQ-dependent sugar dehydrogenase [Thermoleophilaceae bacterium]
MRRLLLPVLLLLLCPALAAAEVRVEKVGDFDSPVFLAAAPGDYSRLYVVEKGGKVRVHRGGSTLAAPFLSHFPGELSAGYEQGLLSLVFRPDFQASRLLYVYYTDSEGDQRVDELRAASADRVDSTYRRKVIEIPHRAAANHNGGTIAFGPDGHLYLAPGDGGNGQAGNAQNKESLLGKVLRIDPTPGGGYSVPADNPFVGQPGADEIWSYGLRNPYRFTVDPVTGDLAIGDVGQNTTEELNFVPARQGAGRGVNFGWNTCEGSFLTGSTTASCNLASTAPVLEHLQSAGWKSIVAGYVVRDPSLPSLSGRLIYGDVSLGQVWSAEPTTPKARDAKRLLNLP